jgi:citrate lyase subunit beta/citryl-CoA lyase
MSALLGVAHSFLFVPATRPDRYGKALASGADVVVIDLEDAVAPDEKESARIKLGQGLDSLDRAALARLVVRVNAAGTPWHAEDAAVLGQWTSRGVAGAMVPKAESPQELARLSATLDRAARLLPLVESVQGLDCADLLARAPQVARLAFGHLDFQLDAGMQCAGDEAPLQPVRTALVLASRRAGIAAPVDGVTVAKDDRAACERDALRARQGGFGGKLCIHPAQVPWVNATFSPSAEEVAWARRVLERAHELQAGAFALEGRMIDAPVLAAARRVLGQASG